MDLAKRNRAISSIIAIITAVISNGDKSTLFAIYGVIENVAILE